MASRQERNKKLSQEEIEALRTQTAADLCAVAALHEKAAAFTSPRDEACIPTDAAERKAYLELHQQMFGLLYQMLCREDLLWYETESGGQTGGEVPDLCRTLRHFLNEAEWLTYDYLTIGEHSVPHYLYADVVPERLAFVLLHQLVLMWSEVPAMNTVELFAEKTGSELLIEVGLCHENNEESRQDTLPALPLGEDFAAETDAVTERFCKRFRARVIRRKTGDRLCCRMVLPAADIFAKPMQLQSDGAPQLIGSRTVYHAVYSMLVPAEVLLMGDFDD